MIYKDKPPKPTKEEKKYYKTMHSYHITVKGSIFMGLLIFPIVFFTITLPPEEKPNIGWVYVIWGVSFAINLITMWVLHKRVKKMEKEIDFYVIKRKPNNKVDDKK